MLILNNMDLIEHKEGSPIVISLNVARESADSLAHAIQIVVGPIRSHLQTLLKQHERVAVAIAGGSAVGKSDFFTPALINGLPSTLVISEDNYCVGNSVSRRRFGTPNLHVPEDFDPELLAKHIAALKRGHDIDKPIYSYEVRERVGTTRVAAGKILVVEGEFLLHPPLSSEFDLKVFINSDDHSRFVRRMIRPRRNPKQTDLERVMEYFRLSFPHYHSHIAPTMPSADFIIENAYHPQEGRSRMQERELEVLFEGSSIGRVFMAMYPDVKRQAFDRRYFTHSRQEPSEVLYVHSDEVGNYFRYSCGAENQSGNGIISPWITFDLKKTPIDLADVGYTQTVQIEGQEWCVTGEDYTVRLFQLPDDRSVIQIKKPMDSGDAMHSQQIIQKLVSAGLSRSSQTLDEWMHR